MRPLGWIAALLIAGSCITGAGSALAGDRKSPADMHHGKHAENRWASLFAGMSPEGIEILSAAMKRDRTSGNSAEVMKARRRVLELITAQNIDVEAIRRAQAEERRLVMEKHAKAQERMLRAYHKLSLEDRRVFAQNMRLREERMLWHMQQARERMEKQREQYEKQFELIRERARGDETGFMIIIPRGPFAPILLIPDIVSERDYG